MELDISIIIIILIDVAVVVSDTLLSVTELIIYRASRNIRVALCHYYDVIRSRGHSTQHRRFHIRPQ